MACDPPGAGYIHPMGVLAIPDLVEIGVLTGDDHFLKAAELLQAGCNETVETPTKAWGYAMPGSQELALPGVTSDADDETLLHAFEAHVGRFEEIAEAKYAGGDLVDGEIRIHDWDIMNIPTF